MVKGGTELTGKIGEFLSRAVYHLLWSRFVRYELVCQCFPALYTKLLLFVGEGGVWGLSFCFWFLVFHFKIILYAPNVCFADGHSDIVLLCCNE